MQLKKPSLVAASFVGIVTAVLVVVSAVLDGEQHGGPFVRVVPASFDLRVQADHLPVPWPPGARQLANDINRAQQVIDDRASSSGDLRDAAFLEQMAIGALAGEKTGARRTTLALLRPRAAATMRTDLAASAALSRLSVPRKRFPPWKIIQPPAPGTLLAYFRRAQARFGVGWQYLAAIESVETRFGRIRGASSAGAQGPMQFLPATWANYGRGNIDNPRDAIFAAARFLVANGAPGNMAAVTGPRSSVHLL